MGGSVLAACGGSASQTPALDKDALYQEASAKLSGTVTEGDTLCTDGDNYVAAWGNGTFVGTVTKSGERIGQVYVQVPSALVKFSISATGITPLDVMSYPAEVLMGTKKVTFSSSENPPVCADR